MRLPMLTLACLLAVCTVSMAVQAQTTAEPAPNNETNADVGTFTRLILPTIQDGFGPVLASETGLDLTSWETIIAGSDFGEVLIPYDADRSLMIELAENPPEGVEAPSAQQIRLVRSWIDAGAKSDRGEVPFENSTASWLYVPNQAAGIVTAIDTEANVVARVIDLADLGFDKMAMPHHTAVDPDGGHWYVSLIHGNTVLKLSRTGKLVDQVEFETPGMLAVDATSKKLYVGRSMMAVNPPQRIGVVDPGTMALEEADVFFPRPHALAASNNNVYAASLSQNSLIARAGEDAELTDMEGRNPVLVQFAISPDNKTLVVTGQLSNQLYVFDLADPLNPTLTDSVAVANGPWHPSYAPDGSRVYFGNKYTNSVTVVNARNWSVEKVIEDPRLSEPHGSTISPDGRMLYISNTNTKGGYTPRHNFGDNKLAGHIAVIDTQSLEVVKVIEVEEYPSGLNILR